MTLKRQDPNLKASIKSNESHQQLVALGPYKRVKNARKVAFSKLFENINAIQNWLYDHVAEAGADCADLVFLARRRRAWRETKKRMQQMHPPSSSPDLVAVPVESVVESGRVVLGAHLVCVKASPAL
jgi:hypothetical protein